MAAVVYLPFLLVCCFELRFGWVIPDGAGFASYLPSLYLDHDLNLFNQYVHCGIIDRTFIHGAAVTPNGYPLNLWTVGTAVLWTPFWLLGHALTYLTRFLGQSWTPNGFTLYYNLGIHFATAWMGFYALFLNKSNAERYVDSRSAIMAVALITFGTPFYWYLFQLADASHVPASFVIALFVAVFLAYRNGERSRITGLLLGLLGGLATITKPNNILIFLFPLVLWFSEFRQTPRRKLLSEIGWVLLGAGLTILLQITIWQILFGNPAGPMAGKGVTHHYHFFTGHFWLIDVLFSSYHGLLFFSPVLLFSFLGLVLLLRTDRLIAMPAILILVLQILLMANERYFWEGAAFGLRRFVDWTPLFTLGLAYACRHVLRSWLKVFPVVACIWTVLLHLTYSAKPTHVLLNYQPPQEIFSWILEMIADLPERMTKLLDLPAPAHLYLPAFLVFGALGFLLFYGLLKVRSSYLEPQANQSRSPHVLIMVILVLLILTYGTVGLAAFNGESSKRKYNRQLEWLAKNQERVLAAEETEFVMHEGKYLALSRSWENARASFLEAIQMSPDPAATAAQIRAFACQHLPRDQAIPFLRSLRIAER